MVPAGPVAPLWPVGPCCSLGTTAPYGSSGPAGPVVPCGPAGPMGSLPGLLAPEGSLHLWLPVGLLTCITLGPLEINISLEGPVGHRPPRALWTGNPADPGLLSYPLHLADQPDLLHSCGPAGPVAPWGLPGLLILGACRALIWPTAIQLVPFQITCACVSSVITISPTFLRLLDHGSCIGHSAHY